MITIYTLSDPTNNSIRYIGQTSNIKSRYQNHLRGNRYRNTHTTNWIQGLLNKGLKPIMNIIDICSKENLDEVEQFYIREYKNNGYDLTNHSIGGHSSLGCKHSIESRLKRSERQKGRKLIISEEAMISKKIKHSEYLKNNPHQRIDNILSKEERYIAALKGNKIGSERRKRKVYKYDINGKLIAEYNSVKEAALLNNINKITLGSWCRGEYKQCGEYIYKYNNI